MIVVCCLSIVVCTWCVAVVRRVLLVVVWRCWLSVECVLNCCVMCCLFLLVVNWCLLFVAVVLVCVRCCLLFVCCSFVVCVAVRCR